MVPIGTQPHYGVRPVRVSLRLRRRLPRITAVWLALGIRESCGQLRYTPDPGQGRNKGVLRVPVHLPQL